MRTLAFLVVVLLALVPVARAAQAADPVLLNALQAYQTNGIDAFLNGIYADRPVVAAEMKDRLLKVAAPLGQVIGTEVVAIQRLSRRVTRTYVAVYYTRCPLWFRLERYESADGSGEKSFYFPVRFSLNPDEILPGYLTEFQP